MIRDTIETVYPLRAADMPLVRRGDTVAAGDVIARGARSAAIVPYAAALRLSVEAAAEAIARHHEIAYEAGASLGAHRSGLITRSVAAPAAGTARGLARSGAILIHDDTAVDEYRARRGGVVRDISTEAIVIISDVARCHYAWADDDRRRVGPLHIEPALLDAALTLKTMPRALPPASSLVVAHIAETAALHAVSRSMCTAMFVGSVSEPVAWALLSRQEARGRHRTQGPCAVLLSGLGDLTHGARAVARFRAFHGAQVTLDRLVHLVSIIPPSGIFPETETTTAANQQAAVRRDPAQYNVPCEIRGVPSLSTLSTGARALCIQSDGHRSLPVENVDRD